MEQEWQQGRLRDYAGLSVAFYILRKAYHRSNPKDTQEFIRFRNKNCYWLKLL